MIVIDLYKSLFMVEDHVTILQPAFFLLFTDLPRSNPHEPGSI